MSQVKQRSLDDLIKERELGELGFCVVGRVFGSEIGDEEYLELCKAFGRSEQGKGAEPSKEFKKDRFITFIASDETPDSYGDVLRVDGCDLWRFKKGAAAFISSHDMRDLSGACGVIVKATKVKNVEGSPEGKAVLVTVYFPTFEEDPDADRIFKKYKAGTLNAVSVGLSVDEMHDPADPKERKALGLGPYGVEVRKWTPHELSAVTVGANPNALIRKALSKSISADKGIDIDSFVDKVAQAICDKSKITKENEQGLVKLLDKFPIQINV